MKGGASIDTLNEQGHNSYGISTLHLVVSIINDETFGLKRFKRLKEETIKHQTKSVSKEYEKHQLGLLFLNDSARMKKELQDTIFIVYSQWKIFFAIWKKLSLFLFFQVRLKDAK